MTFAQLSSAQGSEGIETEEERIEAEFVASDRFRSATLIAPVWSGLHVDGEYFGSPEFDVGIVGASWRLKWKALSFAPGIGIGIGGQADAVPIATVRWHFETSRWISQGFYAQSLREQGLSEEEAQEEVSEAQGDRQYASILDNNHISVRFSRFEAGALWEHIQYREEDEWKGGVRGAVRLGAGFKLLVQVLGPDTEVRGGIAFER
jgi:hypothetical protein